MNKSISSNVKYQMSPEQRVLTRQRVLHSGVIVTLDQRNVIDCRIRDLHVRGAQILVEQCLPEVQTVWLVNSHEQRAHFSEIRWNSSKRYGLEFVRSYPLEDMVPKEVAFLRAVLVRTKLNQIRLLMGHLVPFEQAVCTVGLNARLLELALGDAAFVIKNDLLWAQVRKLLLA